MLIICEVYGKNKGGCFRLCHIRDSAHGLVCLKETVLKYDTHTWKEQHQIFLHMMQPEASIIKIDFLIHRQLQNLERWYH